MSPEFADRHLTERMRKEADPTALSTIQVEGVLKHIDTLKVMKASGHEEDCRVFQDESGQEYYEVTTHPHTQQVVARLLKGVINVSDVLEIPAEEVGGEKGKTVFLSKKIDLKAIKNELPSDQVYAPLIVYRALFGDVDHGFYSDPEPGDPQHMNLRYDGKHMALYDFDETRRLFFKPEGVANIRDSFTLLDYHSLPALLAAQEITEKLAKRFEKPGGRVFVARIFKSVSPNVFSLFIPNNEVADADWTVRQESDYFHAVFYERIKTLRRELRGAIARARKKKP